MPYKDKEKRNAYIAEYRRKKRRERGLQKQGRKTVIITEEDKQNQKARRRTYHNEWIKEYFQLKPEKRLWMSAKRRAKVKGLPFSITQDDIIVPTHCPYLGTELTMNARRGTKRDSVCSLDRIIPELGYVKGNVEVISHLANTMKQAATEEQLLSFAKTILSRYE